MSSLRAFVAEIRDQIKQDVVPVSAAGIAFFGFFALFPALGAVISIYGLVADPNDVADQLNAALDGAPDELRVFLVDQAIQVAGANSGALTAGVAIGILVALWSASSAVQHLIAALNRIYGFRETRGFVALRGASYLFTTGAAAVLAIAMFSMAALPTVLAALDMGTFGRVIIGIVRFPAMVLFMAVSLSVLYFLAPNRPSGYRYRWVTKGSIIATSLWVVLSGLLSIYFTNVPGGSSTGLLLTLTMLMLWLQITSLCVLLGAEVDSTTELLERRSIAVEEVRVATAMTPSGRSTLLAALVGLAAGLLAGRRR